MGGMKGTGIANIAAKKTRGAQFAGVTNIMHAQARGGANIVTGDVSHAQVAAVFNYAKTLRGLQ